MGIIYFSVMKTIKPLPYYGGKAGYGKAAWIADLLPWTHNSLYVETHGGQAGVLCAREPVQAEIYNDLDSRAANWHRVLQNQPEDLAWGVECQPHSREIFEDAQKTLQDQYASDLDRAIAYNVVAIQTVSQNMNTKDGRKLSWKRRFSNSGPGSNGRWRMERVFALASRFDRVQIENIDAVDLLDRISSLDYAVIYVDPPYRTANVQAYLHNGVDTESLTHAVQAQAGRVAISGQGSEWDHLGWNRHEKLSSVRSKPWQKQPKTRSVYEFLWTNF